MEPFFTWTPATWIGGVLLNATWNRRHIVKANDFNATLNFTKIGDTVTQTVLYQSVTNLQNQVSQKHFF
jgi:hypothetical protein